MMETKQALRADRAYWRYEYFEATASAFRSEEDLRRAREERDALAQSLAAAQDYGSSLELQVRDLKRELYAARIERSDAEQSIRDLIFLGVIPDRWLTYTAEEGDRRSSVLNDERLALDALALHAEQEREADDKELRDAKKAINAHKA